MKKGFSLIFLLLIVFAVGIIGWLGVRFFLGGNEDDWICQSGQWVKHGNPSASKPTTPCSTKQASSVPLPTGEDIVRSFFELINEKRIPEAVLMMTKINTENDSTKQAGGVQFNAFESIKAKSIEAYDKENWTNDQQEYKVNLAVQMKPEAASGPIPNYGFDNGDNNIRWVILVKENNLWKISGIATGP